MTSRAPDTSPPHGAKPPTPPATPWRSRAPAWLPRPHMDSRRGAEAGRDRPAGRARRQDITVSHSKSESVRRSTQSARASAKHRAVGRRTRKSPANSCIIEVERRRRRVHAPTPPTVIHIRISEKAGHGRIRVLALATPTRVQIAALPPRVSSWETAAGSLGHLGVLRALPLHVLEEAAVVDAPHGLPRQEALLVPRQHVQGRPLQLRREPAMIS